MKLSNWEEALNFIFFDEASCLNMAEPEENYEKELLALSFRVIEQGLNSYQEGAQKSAIVKRYKFNLFKEFMLLQELYGNYERKEMSATVANRIAQKIIGRVFSIQWTNKVFAEKGRTASKKSKYLLDGTIDDLVQLLDKEWVDQGYAERMFSAIGHAKPP